MIIKKTNKAEIEKWLAENKLTKLPTRKAEGSYGQQTHVAYASKGKWLPKDVKRVTKKEKYGIKKKKRAAAFKTRKLLKSKAKYQERMKFFKAKKFDQELNTLMEFAIEKE